MNAATEIDGFIHPERVYTRAEVLARPCPVPVGGGAYGWWFRRLPAPIDTSGCVTRDGLTLLYVGISPKKPPANGRPPSRQGLRSRVRYHYAGNAEGSTLRKTLGCLLADELGLELRRVGSGHRLTFAGGELLLSAWMAENAFVSWIVTDRPWDLEASLIGTLSLPLNLDGNEAHPFHLTLSRSRSDSVHRAHELPIVGNRSVGGARVPDQGDSRSPR